MKLCIVNENFTSSSTNGLNNYYRLLTKELVKKGINVTVITNTSDDENEEFKNGLKLIKIKEDENYKENIKKKLIDLQNNGEIDIIEASNYNLLTYDFEKERKLPLVIKAYKPFLNKDNVKYEKKLFNNADLVVTSSNMIKEEINTDNIKVLPKILNDDFYNQKEKREKNKTILFCGKLTEENGILNLAKIIPDLIEELGNVKFLFIGEDDNNNINNIYAIIDKQFHKNLEFISHMDNEELNNLYNDCRILVSPRENRDTSYVMLEAMQSGIPFVSLTNNAINEVILNKEYLTNIENLKERIINLYLNTELSKLIVKQNLEIIETKFNNENNINNMIKEYKKTIEKYDEKIITKLCNDNLKEEIKSAKKIEGDLTNSVYLIETENQKYVAKIYKKHINESSIKSFMNICNKNNINVIKPVDSKFMKVLNSTICIYEYVEGKSCKKLTNEQIEALIEFIKIDKISNAKNESMIEKVDFYYESLRNMETKKIVREVIDELLKKYMKLKNYTIFNERQLVHGDMSPDNIIWDQDGSFTILDLDEVIEFTKLYDLIVFAMNASRKNDEIDIKLAHRILKPFDNYTKIDIINVWNFYIVKILLEKIYLYEIDKIDLKDPYYEDDDFEDWLKILNSNIIEEIINK